MYEKTLKRISKMLKGSEKTYFILTHKRHYREVYFQNNKKAIEFLKIKFDSSLKKFIIIKKVIYFLIKSRVLQIFLKKIKLSKEFGDVIFVANQIKGFNLNKKIVSSFVKEKNMKESFMKSKRIQKKNSEKEFTPKITELNYKIPFSKEELLPEYKGKEDYELFKKLYSFYKYKGIKTISSKKYINFLINKMKEKNIKDDFIKKTLVNLLHHNQNLLTTTIHGNFTKEQILLKEGSYVFIDWETEKNLITMDLAKFFSDEGNLLKNNNFNKILKIYPYEVRKNIKLYLILNEVHLIIEKKKSLKASKVKEIVIEKITKPSKNKIKNILKTIELKENNI
jgi:hypothetical protein|tara:strand:- start:607 stop:1620 length:1014 start_codon:yes stop_codon:yes gene_type:complete